MIMEKVQDAIRQNKQKIAWQTEEELKKRTISKSGGSSNKSAKDKASAVVKPLGSETDSKNMPKSS